MARSYLGLSGIGRNPGMFFAVEQPGGGAGRPKPDINSWINSAQGYQAPAKPWMLSFADKWLTFIESGNPLTPQMVDFARTWYADAMRSLNYDPTHAQPAFKMIEDLFSAHKSEVEGFGRCVLRLADFSVIIAKEDPKAFIDDYVGTLQILKAPKLLESGLRLATVIYQKTAGHKLAVRCMLSDLPVELFKNSASLFESAVARLAKTRTILDEFIDSIINLKKIYAAKPYLFNEGLDIIDNFHDALEARGVSHSTLTNIIRDILPFLIETYAGYSIEVLEKAEVESSHISTILPVKVSRSANPPTWFNEQIEKLKNRLLTLQERGIDPGNYIAAFIKLNKWIEKGENNRGSIVLETTDTLYQALLAGELEGRKCSDIELLTSVIFDLKILELARAEHLRNISEREYQSRREWYLTKLDL